MTVNWIKLPWRQRGDIAEVPYERWRKPFTAAAGNAAEAIYGTNTTDFGGVSPFFYRKDPFGVVTFRGALATTGAVWAANETLLSLPAGYRPPTTFRWVVHTNHAVLFATTDVAYVTIGSTGLLLLQGGTAAATAGGRLSLDVIRYRAEP